MLFTGLNIDCVFFVVKSGLANQSNQSKSTHAHTHHQTVILVDDNRMKEESILIPFHSNTIDCLFSISIN